VPIRTGRIDLTGHESVISRQLSAETIKIANRGFRSLEDVELHLPVDKEPFSIKKKRPSTLSEAAITTDWEAGILRIKVKALPAGEEFGIELFSIGAAESSYKTLLGTGGKYKVVRKAKYDLIRGGVNNLAWMIAFGALWYFLGRFDALHP